LPLLGSNQDSPDPESAGLGRHYRQPVGIRPLPEHRCPLPGHSLPDYARRNYGKTTALPPFSPAPVRDCAPSPPDGLELFFYNPTAGSSSAHRGPISTPWRGPASDPGSAAVKLGPTSTAARTRPGHGSLPEV